MNYFTFVKNNWAKLGLANYKTGVSSAKMKEAFKKSKGVSKGLQRYNKQEAILQEEERKSARAMDKKTSDRLRALINSKDDDENDEILNNIMYGTPIPTKTLLTKGDAVQAKKLREAQLQERAKPRQEEGHEQYKKVITMKHKKNPRQKKGRALIEIADNKLTVNSFKLAGFLREAIELYYRRDGKRLSNLSKANMTRLHRIIEQRNIPLKDLKQFYNDRITYYNEKRQ